tara:strand:- start:502 stop:1386 length:885 start_codon:yes stop_codon:yes gene_type:complete
MSNEEENYDSDESVNTEDMNELLANKPTYDGGVERSSKKKEKIIIPKKSKSKKSEIETEIVESEIVEDVVEDVVDEEIKSKKIVKPKKERSPAQKAAFEKLLAKNKEKQNMKKKIIEEHVIKNPIVKKPAGRPRTKPEKPQVVTKEVTKVIYMIPNEDNTGYIEKKNPKPLSERQLKKIDNEKKIKEQEVELGKKLYRTKKGTVDMRSKNNRTQAQIDNSKRLVELNKKRAADRKLQKEKEMKSMISEEVKDSMIDVVTKPIQQVKKERAERKPVITKEQQDAYNFKQHKNLFC